MKAFWLTREPQRRGMEATSCDYMLYADEPVKSLCGYESSFTWEWAGSHIAKLTAKEFHKHSNVRLKPGEGPITVRLTATGVPQ